MQLGTLMRGGLPNGWLWCLLGIAAQIIAVLSSSYEMCPVLYTENYKQEMESMYFALKDAESCRY